MSDNSSPAERAAALVAKARAAIEAKNAAATAPPAPPAETPAPATPALPAAPPAPPPVEAIDRIPIPKPEIPGLTDQMWEDLDKGTKLALHNEYQERFAKQPPAASPPPVAPPAAVPGQIPAVGQPMYAQQTAPINPPDMLGGVAPPVPPAAPPAAPAPTTETPAAPAKRRGRPAKSDDYLPVLERIAKALEQIAAAGLVR